MQTFCEWNLESAPRLHTKLFVRASGVFDGSKFKAVNNRDKNRPVQRWSGSWHKLSESVSCCLRQLMAPIGR
jgi:hypothetical protein